MAQYPQGSYDESDDDPNRVVRAIIEADPTLIIVPDPNDGARYYVAEADLVYVDLSAPNAAERTESLRSRSADYADRTTQCRPHTSEEWCQSHPTHDRTVVDRYMDHLREDLKLEIWDISGIRPEDPNFVRGLISALAEGHADDGSPFLPIPVYATAPWSPSPYGPPLPIERPPGPVAPTPHNAGRTRVAVFDTGLPTHYDSIHPYLGGVAQVPFGVEDPYVSGKLREAAGHGLFIMDIIYRRCPHAAPIIMANVARNATGLTLSEPAIAMILHDLAITFAQPGKGQLVVNMSFTTDPVGDPLKTVLAMELKHLQDLELDLLCVAAAGNDATVLPRWPAALSQTLENVVSVGALTTGTNKIASFSNRGPWVQGWAGGTDIDAAYLKGAYPPPPYATFPVNPGGEPWARWQGTSFAAPQAVAAIVCHSQTRGRRLRDVWDDLVSPAHAFVDTIAETGFILDLP